MASNLIFDFGAVLIPIDEQITKDAFKDLGALETLADQKDLFDQIQKGEIESKDFIEGLKPHFFRKKIFAGDLKAAWNALCYSPIPHETITFLQELKHKGFKLFLLSNTNKMHIEHIKTLTGLFKYRQFYQLFNQVYYSHEIGMAKPEPDIYEKVLSDHELKAEDCFFADDRKENIEAASKLGFNTFHFKPEEHSLEDLKDYVETLS